MSLADNAMWKTALCRRGEKCKYPNCGFAHNVSEMRCATFARTGRCPGSKNGTCKLKHTAAKKPPSVPSVKSPGTNNASPPMIRMLLPRKTPSRTLTSVIPSVIPSAVDIPEPPPAPTTRSGQRRVPGVVPVIRSGFRSFGSPAMDEDSIMYVRGLAPLKVGFQFLARVADGPAKARRALNLDDYKPHLTRSTLYNASTPIKDKLEFCEDLLIMEMLQQRHNIRAYDMYDVTLQAVEHASRLEKRFKIVCAGLAENRPSVLRSDTIYVYEHKHDIWHQGYVHHVNRDHVICSFLHAPSSELRNFLTPANGNGDVVGVDVVFGMPDTPYRHQLRSIRDTTFFLDLSFFERFGKGVDPKQQRYVPPVTAKTSAYGKLDDDQKGFVDRVLFKCESAILWGPPGTGKTTTLVGLAMELMLRGFKILICAPSNAACDVIVERLDKEFSSTGLRLSNWLLRVHSKSVSTQQVVGAVKKCSMHPSFPTLEDVIAKNVIVATLSTTGRLYGIGVDPDWFDFMLVDEAGQCTEGEMMNALVLAGLKSRVVVFGDPKQLGPQIHNRRCLDLGMDISPMERLLEDNDVRDRYTVVLHHNYRAHPSIVDVYNPTYDDALIPCVSPAVSDAFLRKGTLFPTKEHPLLFVHNDTLETREDDSPSWMNQGEINVVMNRIVAFLNAGVRPSDITVLSPYRKQCDKIRATLHYNFLHQLPPFTCPSYNDYNGAPLPITVCSVEKFQGRESPIVILSVVRSREVDAINTDKRIGIGFLSNKKRLNVAVSRAISGFVIIGNAKLLCSRDMEWQRVIGVFAAKRSIVSHQFCMSNVVCDPRFQLTMDDLCSHMQRVVPGVTYAAVASRAEEDTDQSEMVFEGVVVRYE
eukprot:PhM_4_TR12646/c0_g1_i1/m.97054/K18422/MOV10; helicase MOV-10